MLLLLLIHSIDICLADEFDCGSGFCIDTSGECDGFEDCQVNTADENICGIVVLRGQISL